MAINNYTSWRDLACASTAGIVANDIITGGSSGAVALVYSVTNNTKFTVVMISGSFTPTETISNQDSDTCSITADVATTVTVPTNCVIVTGDNSGSTTIFRDIRNASNSGGWGLHTDPSATDNFLYLDATIFIGRKDQTAETVCISEQECADIVTDDNINTIIPIGNSTYKGKLRIGKAEYKSNSLANFPPRKAWNGCIIRAGLEPQDYGVLEIYDTSLDFLDGTPLLGSNSTIAEYYIAQTTLNDSGYNTVGSENANFSDVIFNNTGFILSTGDAQFFRTTLKVINDWTFFVFGLGGEYDISGIEVLDANNDPYHYFGVLYSNAVFHSKNVTSKNNSMLLFSPSYFYDEKSFDLKVIDYDGNPIEDAKVQVLDKSGYSVLFEDTGERLAADFGATDSGVNTNEAISIGETDIITTDNTALNVGDYIFIEREVMRVESKPTTTRIIVTKGLFGTSDISHATNKDIYVLDTLMNVTDYTKFSVGDVIRIAQEKMTVTNASSNPITVTRGSQGTGVNYGVSYPHTSEKKIWCSCKYAETDSNGEISTYIPVSFLSSTPDVNNLITIYSPYTMTIYKDGYETIRESFSLGDGATTASYNYDYFKQQRKLRNSLPQGRDDMADAFK